MSRRIAIAAAAFICLAPAAASAGEIPCWCRTSDGKYELGSVVCLRVGGTERLARCERVQNNTSWKVLSEGCPTARRQTPPDASPVVSLDAHG